MKVVLMIAYIFIVLGGAALLAIFWVSDARTGAAAMLGAGAFVVAVHWLVTGKFWG